MLNVRLFAVLLTALATAACSSNADDAPKLPLGHPEVGAGATRTRTGGPTITGEAKVALDSANHLYSAKDYDRALVQYRRAATRAPNVEAPLFGMLMVATATGNQRLADSATSAMRALQGASSQDSSGKATLLDIHSGAASSPRPRRADSAKGQPRANR